jgi:hypothetical protein
VQTFYTAAELRQTEVKFKDAVPDQNPPLVSPCNF